jgi:2'-5' RNA ligase
VCSGVRQSLIGGHAQPVRAFIAIPVLPPAQATLGMIVLRLQREVAAVRWAAVETMHVTLHFFGEISEKEAARALETLAVVTGGQRHLRLRLRGLDAFEERGFVRVLWCGLDGDVEELTALATGCRGALRRGGFEVDHRPFRAHCTLGRPRRGWPDGARSAWEVARAARPETPQFVADRAVLYETVTGAGGRHVPRATLLFAGPARGSALAPASPPR